MRDKHKKFIELAEKRVNRLLKDIRLVGNLSNRNNYVFSDTEVRKILTAVDNEVKAMKTRFERSGSGSASKFKL